MKNFASKKLKEEKKSDEKKSSLSLPEFVFYEPRTETGGEHDLTDSLDPRGVWYRTEPNRLRLNRNETEMGSPPDPSPKWQPAGEPYDLTPALP